MAYCPKCGKKVKYRRKSDGLKHCRRHGPVEKYPYIRATVGDTLERHS